MTQAVLANLSGTCKLARTQRRIVCGLKVRKFRAVPVPQRNVARTDNYNNTLLAGSSESAEIHWSEVSSQFRQHQAAISTARLAAQLKCERWQKPPANANSVFDDDSHISLLPQLINGRSDDGVVL